ncbi:hypothetical protein Sango_3020600 [Sesamum angolense]|uniref:DUF4283 domain-containing protein n=1 Tax=Sesamum angolense TaxID=2727404 RepID=A0AAE1T3M2_9LAMI|nr:hypothetical protein Sango_3020600 [Sesamum angolense]
MATLSILMPGLIPTTEDSDLPMSIGLEKNHDAIHIRDDSVQELSNGLDYKSNSNSNSTIDTLIVNDCPFDNYSIDIIDRSVPEQSIFIGNVKLRTDSNDSIADAFLQSSRKTLHYVPPTKQNGEIIVRPSTAIIEKGSKRWHATAVGYFLGRKPYFPQLESFARSNWRDIQQVSATSSGFYIFQFKSRAAMEDIIEGGPWLFQGQPIVLQYWEPGMSLRRQKHRQIPVWIRLKHLPMEY